MSDPLVDVDGADPSSPDHRPSRGNRDGSVKLSRFAIRIGPRTLLDGVDAEFRPRQIAVIVGPSGAGKSLLLRAMAGLPMTDDAITTDGEIRFGETTTTRPPVSVVFQNHALFDELTPLQNVEIATNSIKQDSALTGGTLSPRQWLDSLSVPISVPTSRLSGGQKQRLAIARSLASGSPIVFYDEPTSGLDAATADRVANLIRDTHDQHDVTGVIVTHDYASMVPIADSVWLFDAAAKTLRPLTSNDPDDVRRELAEMTIPSTVVNERAGDASPMPSLATHAVAALDEAVRCTGAGLRAAASTILRFSNVVPSDRWHWRWLVAQLRRTFSAVSLLYMLLAGAIVGFVTTYFTFEFLPYRVYTHPLLLDDLLASIGFAAERIFVPILSSVLVAARTGAALSSDVGVRQYGGQIDAMRTLRLAPRRYLWGTMSMTMMIAMPIMTWVAFVAAKFISMATFLSLHPDQTAIFWRAHFEAQTGTPESYAWVSGKAILCGLGIATVAFHRGMRSKSDADDVGRDITSTVFLATMWVLAVHLVASFFEF